MNQPEPHSPDPLQQLWDLAYGLLDEAEAFELQQELARDPSLAEQYQQVRQEVELLGRAARYEAPGISLPSRAMNSWLRAVPASSAWVWVTGMAAALLAVAAWAPWNAAQTAISANAADLEYLLVSADASAQDAASVTVQFVNRPRPRTSASNDQPLEYRLFSDASGVLDEGSLTPDASGQAQLKLSREKLLEASRLELAAGGGLPPMSIPIRQEPPPQPSSGEQPAAKLAMSNSAGAIPAPAQQRISAAEADLDAKAAPSDSLRVLGREGESAYGEGVEKSAAQKFYQFSQAAYGPAETVRLRWARDSEQDAIDSLAALAGNEILPVPNVAEFGDQAEIRFSLPDQPVREARLYVGTRGGDVRTIPVPLHSGLVEVSFFPEGGRLVRGVSNRVRILTVDEQQRPIPVRGRLEYSPTAPTISVTTDNQGQGVVDVVPQESELGLSLLHPANAGGKRIAAVTAEPAVALQALNDVAEVGEPLSFLVGGAASQRPLVAAAYVQSELVGQKFIGPAPGLQPPLRVSLPLASTAQGLIRLIVFDYAGSTPQALAQRLFLRYPPGRLQVRVGNHQESYPPGADVDRLRLFVTDDQGRAEQAELSVAVVSEAEQAEVLSEFAESMMGQLVPGAESALARDMAEALLAGDPQRVSWRLATQPLQTSLLDTPPPLVVSNESQVVAARQSDQWQRAARRAQWERLGSAAGALLGCILMGVLLWTLVLHVGRWRRVLPALACSAAALLLCLARLDQGSLDLDRRPSGTAAGRVATPDWILNSRPQLVALQEKELLQDVADTQAAPAGEQRPLPTAEVLARGGDAPSLAKNDRGSTFFGATLGRIARGRIGDRDVADMWAETNTKPPDVGKSSQASLALAHTPAWNFAQTGLEAEGSLDLNLRLPDRPGDYHVLVLARRADRWGLGKGVITVHSPLQLAAVLPEELTEGDELWLKPSAGGLAGQDQLAVSVGGAIAVRPITETSSEALSEQAETPRSDQQLTPPAPSADARLVLEARAIGEAQVDFAVTANQQQRVLRETLRVLPRGYDQVMQREAVAQGKDDFTVLLDKDVDKSSLRVDLGYLATDADPKTTGDGSGLAKKGADARRARLYLNRVEQQSLGESRQRNNSAAFAARAARPANDVAGPVANTQSRSTPLATGDDTVPKEETPTGAANTWAINPANVVAGENKFQLQLPTDQPVPYWMAFSYKKSEPPEDPDCPLQMQVKLASTALSLGEETVLSVEIVPQGLGPTGPFTAEISLPAGLRAIAATKAELDRQGVIAEIHGRALQLHWPAAESGRAVAVHTPLRAGWSGRFQGRPSRVYLDDQPQRVCWSPSLHVEINGF